MEKQYFEPADIKVFVLGKGVVVNEKGLITIDKEEKKVVAVGNKALQAAEENKSGYEVISAFHLGRISDYFCAEKILMLYMQKAGIKRISFAKPEIIVCIPEGLNMVEKKAYEEAVYQGGAKKVYLSEKSFEAIINNIEQTEYGNAKYVIGITKEEPLAYVKEALSEAFDYAKAQGFDKEWIQSYLETYK